MTMTVWKFELLPVTRKKNTRILVSVRCSITATARFSIENLRPRSSSSSGTYVRYRYIVQNTLQMRIMDWAGITMHCNSHCRYLEASKNRATNKIAFGTVNPTNSSSLEYHWFRSTASPESLKKSNAISRKSGTAVNSVNIIQRVKVSLLILHKLVSSALHRESGAIRTGRMQKTVWMAINKTLVNM